MKKKEKKKGKMSLEGELKEKFDELKVLITSPNSTSLEKQRMVIDIEIFVEKHVYPLLALKDQEKEKEKKKEKIQYAPVLPAKMVHLRNKGSGGITSFPLRDYDWVQAGAGWFVVKKDGTFRKYYEAILHDIEYDF